MTAIKRSAQASLVFIQSGALPPVGISQSWTATSCPASLRVQAIQCALVPSAELKLMKNFCPIAARYRARFPRTLFLLVPIDDCSFPSSAPRALDGPNQGWNISIARQKGGSEDAQPCRAMCQEERWLV